MEAQDHRKSETVWNQDLKWSAALLMAVDRAVCTALVTAIMVVVPPPLLSKGWVFWGVIGQGTAPRVVVPPPLFSREYPRPSWHRTGHRPWGGGATTILF